MFRRFRDLHDSFSRHSVLSFCSTLCDCSRRPLSAVLKFRAVVLLIADALEVPSPFDSRIVTRLAKGLARQATQDKLSSDPVVDVAKVLLYLRTSFLAGAPVSRAAACAALAAVVPSRPSELCSLQSQDLIVTFPDARVGYPHDVFVVREDWAKVEPPRPGTPYRRFALTFKIRNSKTDKDARATIDKTLTHPEWAEWSPALLLLGFACRRAAQGHKFLFGALSGAAKPLSVATISADLASVSMLATAVSITAKFWRSSAATWLLLNGLDVESVAALGGWASTEMLRRRYVRSTLMPDDLALKISGQGTISSYVRPVDVGAGAGRPSHPVLSGLPSVVAGLATPPQAHMLQTARARRGTPVRSPLSPF